MCGDGPRLMMMAAVNCVLCSLWLFLCVVSYVACAVCCVLCDDGGYDHCAMWLVLCAVLCALCFVMMVAVNRGGARAGKTLLGETSPPLDYQLQQKIRKSKKMNRSINNK